MKAIVTISFCCILSWSCDRSTNATIPSPPTAMTDSCGNDQPLTTADSVLGIWRLPLWSSHYLSFSADKKYFTTSISDRKQNSHYGVTVVDAVTQQIILFFPYYHYAVWSPDGKYLMVFSSRDGIPTLVNMETMAQSKFTSMSSFSKISWDEKGKYVYLSREGYDRDKPFPYNKWGLFRARPDGSELEYLTDSLWDAKVLDSENLISFFPRGGYFGFNILRYHLPTRTITKDTVYGYEGNTVDVSNVDLSPDRTKLVFDRVPYIWEATEERNQYGGVWILDLKTKQSRQVLPEQFSKHPYYPRWYSNTELLCSFYCRKDSAITTWLVDLNGKVLRQITNKNMKLIP